MERGAVPMEPMTRSAGASDARTATQENRWLGVAQQVAALVFGPIPERQFTLRYWDSGVSERPGIEPSRFTLVLTHPGALRRMLLPPSQLHLAESFIYGDYDIEGDVEAAAATANIIRARLAKLRTLIRVERLVLGLPRGLGRHGDATRHLGAARSLPRHSLARDAAAVRSHYDVGNDFYLLFLDPRMIYSCAYFDEGVTTLADAQTAKLDHICRKLRLAPGERLLDIGCGWGGLILYAAKHYGVEALGVTLSVPQAGLAEHRIAEAGLSDRCRVEVRDYRDLVNVEPFDKVVSVGMAEHVGWSHLARYFRDAWRLTRPGGLFLNHCITKDKARRRRPRVPGWRDGVFTKRYVFPDGDLVRLSALATRALDAGFDIRDVESLREHYALTLRAWVRNLERNEPQAVQLVGRETYRVWRLHMGGAAEGFASKRLNLHQMLLARPDGAGNVTMPATRRDLYQRAAR